MTVRDPDDPHWLAELSMLLWRHADLGIGSDVGAMHEGDLRAVYRFLVRRSLAFAKRAEHSVHEGPLRSDIPSPAPLPATIVNLDNGNDEHEHFRKE